MEKSEIWFFVRFRTFFHLDLNTLKNKLKKNKFHLICYPFSHNLGEIWKKNNGKEENNDLDSWGWKIVVDMSFDMSSQEIYSSA